MEGVLLAKRHNATNKDLAVGNEHFKKEIKALTDRQMLPAKTLIPSHGEIREGWVADLVVLNGELLEGMSILEYWEVAIALAMKKELLLKLTLMAFENSYKIVREIKTTKVLKIDF